MKSGILYKHHLWKGGFWIIFAKILLYGLQGYDTFFANQIEAITEGVGVFKEKFGSEVRNGDVFIFIGNSRRLMKLILAEDGGMVMYVKRLEAGRFRLPDYDTEKKTYSMEWRDLVVMVEGLKEDPAQRLKRLRAERVEYHV